MTIVSVIIVNWNGAKCLPRCISSVINQSFQDREIIVIDNGSSDNSAAQAMDDWPEIKLTMLERNIGYAAANNLGAHMAQGQWLALLNNDAFPAQDWLENLLRAANNHKDFSFFASRLVTAGNHHIIDATGDILHASGLAWHRDQKLPVEQAHQQADEVFSACAAAALFDRKSFLEVGGFDEEYQSHHEDVDLGFRLRLAGQRCLYVPDAVVEHIGGASYGVDSTSVIYQMHRNFVWSYFKDMPGSLAWKFLPAHILANLVFLFGYTLKGQGKAIWKAKIDAIRGLPGMLRKRKIIEASRVISHGEISRLINRGWISPYILGRQAARLQSWKTSGKIRES